MSKDDEARLLRLLDRADISEVQLRYARGTDSHDWELFRTCFMDEIEADFSQVVGRPAARVDTDAWVAGVAPTMESFAATHHAMSNIVIEFDGDDHATCHTYVQAAHHKPNASGGSDLTVYGFYENQYTRTADGWKIAKLKLNVRWMSGNYGVFGA